MSLCIRHRNCVIALWVFFLCLSVRNDVCTLVCTAELCKSSRKVYEPWCRFYYVFKIVFYEMLILLGIMLITKSDFLQGPDTNLEFNLSPLPKSTNVSHHPFPPFSIGTINFKTMGYWLLFNQNFALTYKWIPSLFSPILSLENFNADVAITMKMWDIVMSTQGGRGFASFVGTINLLAFRDKQPILPIQPDSQRKYVIKISTRTLAGDANK